MQMVDPNKKKGELVLDMEVAGEMAITPGIHPDTSEDCFIIRTALLVNKEQFLDLISRKKENHTYKIEVK